jgi:hypothetical protein
MAGALALYALAGVWLLLWDYVPFFPALVTFGALIGLPMWLLVSMLKAPK